MRNLSIATATLALSIIAGVSALPLAATAHVNPVDPISNPQRKDFTNVSIQPRDMAAPFVRDGALTGPERFAPIRAGLPQADVQNLLGEPLTKQGATWDYNFKFALPQSQNYLVCQYKVTFDQSAVVSEATWRRRQCQDLAAAAPVSE